MYFDIGTFSAPIISTVVYVLIELLKRFVKHDEKIKRWYPAVAAVLGMLLGWGAYMTGAVPIMATNAAGALFIGLCSGLCATGTDQLIHKIMEERNRDK